MLIKFSKGNLVPSNKFETELFSSIDWFVSQRTPQTGLGQVRRIRLPPPSALAAQHGGTHSVSPIIFPV